MKKSLYYIIGLLLCLYGLNIYLNIIILSFFTLIAILNIKKDEFFYLYFIFLFFDNILKLPYGYGGETIFRIYEILFLIRVFMDIKNKKFTFSINKFYLFIPIILITTSFLYNNILVTLSLTINLLILFYIFTNKNKKVNFYDNLLYIMALTGTFAVVYGLFRGNIIDEFYYKRYYFTITDPNYSSLLLNIALFSILGNKVAYSYEKILIVLLCSLGVLLTVSISGIACLIICALIYLYITNKKLLKLTLLLMLFIGLIFISMPLGEQTALYAIRFRILKIYNIFYNTDLNTFTSYRLELFTNYLKYFFKNIPIMNVLFGGLNTISGQFSENMVSIYKHVSHNSFIDILYMTGFFGFISIFGLNIYEIVKNFKICKKRYYNSAINIFMLKIIILFYCTNLSIFPFRYFLAIFMLTFNEKILNCTLNYSDECMKLIKSKKTRILWIVNTIFPYPANQLNKKKSVFGGWLISLHNQIIKNNKFNLAIVTSYNGDEFKYYCDKDTIYYLIPCKNPQNYDPNIKIYFNQIIKDLNPELIHIHGTEYAFPKAIFECENNVKTVSSIQGLISVCGNLYKSGISDKEIIKYITLRDMLKFDTIFDQKKKFDNRGKNEIEILKKSDYIIGRTTWDYAHSYSIAREYKYFKCNEILRKVFYNNLWDISSCIRHTIFFSQATYPIKGLHLMIEALNIVVTKYPDTILYVGGDNIFSNNTVKAQIKTSGYAYYIKSLIKKYNLKNNIVFSGLLSEDQVKDKLLQSNVFVQASAIENSSNALGEAMLLGLPIVATNVGGTSDMLIDKKEGFLFPFNDEALLANYIIKIFEDDSLATNIGTAARKHAKNTHDPNKIYNSIIEIYDMILMEEKK